VELSRKDFDEYISRVGPEKAKVRFSLLGKLNKFKEAYETELGAELLRDIKEAEVELNIKQIMNSYESDRQKEEDRLLLRAYVLIGLKWSDRINTHEKAIREMKG
jgi:hypothetical protein